MGMLDDDVARIEPSPSTVGIPVQRAAVMREDPVSRPAPLEDAWVQATLPHPGRRRRTAAWVAVVDSLAFTAAAVLAPFEGPRSGAIVVVSLLFLNATAHHYRDPVSPAVLDQLPSIATHALVAVGLAVVFGELLDERIHGGFVVLLIGFLCLGRAIAYTVLRRWRSAHHGGRPTIIAGTGPVGLRIATVMLDHPEYGRRPVGFVDDRTSIPGGAPLPWLGRVDELPRLLEDSPACDTIVADVRVSEPRLARTLRSCDRLPGEIFVVPRLPDLCAVDDLFETLSCPLTRLRRSAHRGVTWRLKRLLDVSAAVVCLILLAPVIATVALLVYLEGGPNLIFKQERVGQDHRRFMIWKFRSLAPADGMESATRWSIQGDLRLGPVGRMLRTLSLDELPQLWNVIRGDMSLVGPRPERPYFVEQFSDAYPHYDDRHRVPAGLTGWAQISGLRGDTDISERAHMDNRYITSWSLWNDVKTLVRTAGSFVSRSGR